jgi:acylphosphatase
VSGRVQGVGFRYSCARAAIAAGVAGWVRNLPDGAVEAAFEGEEHAVDAMTDWMRSGPRWAHVTSVDTSEEDPASVSVFDIRP